MKKNIHDDSTVLNEKQTLKRLYDSTQINEIFDDSYRLKGKKGRNILPNQIHLNNTASFSLTKDFFTIVFSALLPCITLLVIWFLNDIYPFADKVIIDSAIYNEYLPYLQEARNKILSFVSLHYSFASGNGHDFWQALSFGILSPFNILSLLFSAANLVKFFYIVLVIKIFFAGFSFSFYLTFAWFQTYFERANKALLIFGKIGKDGENVTRFQKKIILEENDKLFDNQNIAVFICTFMYVFSAFSLANYFIEPLFLDLLILLPLILLALHRLWNDGKIFFYLFIQTLTFIVCFKFIAFVLSFNIIYFIFYASLQHKDKILFKNNTLKLIFFRTAEYVIATFLSSALTISLLWPVIFPDIMNFNLHELLQLKFNFLLFINNAFNHYSNAILTSGFGLYLPLLALSAFILYFSCMSISLREKTAFFLSLILIYFVISNTYINKIMQAFTFNTFKDNNYSYLIFWQIMILLIVFRTLTNFYSLKVKLALIMSALSLMFYVFLALMGSYLKIQNRNIFSTPELTAMLIFIFYLFLLIMGAIKIKSLKWINIMIGLSLISELIYSGHLFFAELGNEAVFGLQNNLKNISSERLYDDVLSISEINKYLKAKDNNFYRLSLPKSDNYNPGLLYSFNSLTAGGSLININNLDFMKALGNPTYNDYYYIDQNTAIFDMLFSLKYNLRRKNLGRDISREVIYLDGLNNDRRYTIYQRNLVLPPLYVCYPEKLELLQQPNFSDDVFKNQEKFLNNLASTSYVFFENVKINSEINNDKMLLTLNPESDGQVYIYLRINGPVRLNLNRIYKNDNPIIVQESGTNLKKVTDVNEDDVEKSIIIDNSQIIDLGYAEKNKKLSVSIEKIGIQELKNSDKYNSYNMEASLRDLVDNMHAVSLNYDYLQQVYNKINSAEAKLQINTAASRMDGEFVCNDNSGKAYLCLTVPYNKNLIFRIDDKRVVGEAAANKNFTIIPMKNLSLGKHSISVYYSSTKQNFIFLAIISVVSILFLMIVYSIEKKWRDSIDINW